MENMSHALPVSNKRAILKDRGEMLAKARAFFHARHVLEVDCPLLTTFASVDAHIDLIPANPIGTATRYLHSSPEYGMKRLISLGIGDIYQLAHVFRNGECGVKHNPEFTMAEWYRLGFSFTDMIEETIEFIRLFVGPLSYTTISYREALQRYAGFDYTKMSEKELLCYLDEKGIEGYAGIESDSKDNLLNLILGTLVEPQLGLEGLCALTYYPASQAALAKKALREGEEVSERFEIYYRGIELANGYHELGDANEQRMRLEEANQARGVLGKEALPIDTFFLEALEKGFPDCCGVAVGFDRLMLLRHGVSQIADVLAFGWHEA